MVLMATDLAEPVVPGIRRCGMGARSTMLDSPPMFLPRQSGSLATDSLVSLTESNSRKWTFSRCGFGNAMPRALRPGTTGTRAESALIERAMSSASPMTRDDLMPGAGSSSYSVTTGPGWALTISPRTPKSPSTPSSARELESRSDLLSGWRSEAFGAVSTETGGSSNLSDDLRVGARAAAFLRGTRAAGISSSSSSSSKSSSACGARDGAAGAQRGEGRHRQPPQPRLRAHCGMKRPSQRDRAAVIFLHEGRVVVLDRCQFIFLRARTHAARNQECRDHGGEQDDAEHEPIDITGRTDHAGGP